MVDQLGAYPVLCLPNMIQRQVGPWAQEDGSMALKYIFLLRTPHEVPETLAVNALVEAEATDALLGRLTFLPLTTQRRVMVAAAHRLAVERAAHNQAARLLYEAQAYSSLATLLIEQLSSAILSSNSANPTLHLAALAPREPTPDPAAAEARIAQWRFDAAAFVDQWRAADAAAAASDGASLSALLAIAELLYTSNRWRQQRAGAQGEAALTSTLTQLAALPMLPAHPRDVDGAQAALRQAAPQIQRLTPPLVYACVEALHAKFTALKRVAATALQGGAGGASAELRSLRERAEALVAFAALSSFTSPAVGVGMGGQAVMPQAASQMLANWLCSMA